MKMKLIIIFTGLLFIVYSFTLPVKNVKITSTFGETRKDHFHNGIDFGAGEQDVLTVQEGKIIFYSDKNDFPFSQYMGSGNYVMIQHDNDLRSYYMHLKDGSINKTNYFVKEGTMIGRSSDTGHSYGIHLHFSIEKLHPLEILNPLKFFKDQLTDKIKPRIDTIFIQVDQDKLMPLFNNYILKNGRKMSILLKCYDLQNNSNKVNPYKITCFINNEKIREYIFDKMIVKNNFYYLQPNFSFEDIYSKNNVYHIATIDIKEKKYDITIIVEDIYGNQTKTERTIIVKK